MEHRFRPALSRAATRLVGSRFAKPIARVALAAAGLALLAVVGRTAVAGAPFAATPGPPIVATSASTPGPAPPASSAAATSLAPSLAAAAAPGSPGSLAAQGLEPPPSRSRASPEDPVVLNSASEGDLRRLPGIGAKRAAAILALRARLGRLRAIEDLLKVKGVGRATLKRLRPLVRLDTPDAGR